MEEWSNGEIQRRITQIERRLDHRDESHHRLANDYSHHKAEAKIRMEDIEERLSAITTHLLRFLMTIGLGFVAGLMALLGWPS